MDFKNIYFNYIRVKKCIIRNSTFFKIDEILKAIAYCDKNPILEKWGIKFNDKLIENAKELIFRKPDVLNVTPTNAEIKRMTRGTENTKEFMFPKTNKKNKKTLIKSYRSLFLFLFNKYAYLMNSVMATAAEAIYVRAAAFSIFLTSFNSLSLTIPLY